ncbi:hypothetical protein GCM10018793_05110 [Streptomyces sulfonofaciens]|uniref:Uncharacterized protein n=1 Tax=Streptomyces sulfonofaciens TaxID=68272 RepID=A0A919FR21_9ACTN|nr:hypothetical protein GCM10018793_05110 [Streptomyces sulfonofaciens]
MPDEEAGGRPRRLKKAIRNTWGTVALIDIPKEAALRRPCAPAATAGRHGDGPRFASDKLCQWGGATSKTTGATPK